MTKAVFFDWFNTLAHYEPSRAELYQRAFGDLGFELELTSIDYALMEADRYYFAENARSPVVKRSAEEQAQVFARYPQTMLARAGLSAPDDLSRKVLELVFKQFEKVTFVLFDDALPILRELKQKKFTLGLLTNIAEDMGAVCRRLGVDAYIDFTVTSEEVGANKPAPPIFLAALQKAGVDASEAVHVGDQYKLDVLGARGVGIAAVLLDRNDTHPEVKDCPKIRSLSELPQYL